MELFAWVAVIIVSIILIVVYNLDDDKGTITAISFWAGIGSLAIFRYADSEYKNLWQNEISQCNNVFSQCGALIDQAAMWQDILLPLAVLTIISALLFLISGYRWLFGC